MMKNAGKLLIVSGVVFGLLGIRSVWLDYTYRKASVVVKANVLSAEIKDIRAKYGNYYLKPTHHITHHLAFLRDGVMDTLTDKSNFLLYTEGKTTENSGPVPTIEQLMKQEKHVRYVPETRKNETAFPDRIDINNDGKYVTQHRLSFFFQYVVLFCFWWDFTPLFQNKKSIK